MTVRTSAALLTQINTLVADNSTGDISPADLRSVLTDIRDSMAYDASLSDSVITPNPAARTVALPTNYTDYSLLYVAVDEGSQRRGNAWPTAELDTGDIAALRIGSTSAVSWTESTRTIDVGSGETIAFAALIR